MLGLQLQKFLDGDSAGGAPASGNGQSATEPDYKALYEATQAKLTLETAELQKRFGGLQTTFQKEQAAHATVVADLAALKGQFEQTSKGFEAVNAEKETLTKTLTEKEQALAEKEQALARKSVIMEKFPHLAPFEAKGLLPNADPTKLEDVLKLFSDSLDMIGKKAQTEFAAGGVGSQPPKKEDGVRTAASALKDANTAALTGNQEAYTKFYGEYLELSKKK